MLEKIEKWVDRKRRKLRRRRLRALTSDALDHRMVRELFSRAYPDVELLVCRIGDSLFAVSPRDTAIGTHILEGIPFEKDNFDRAIALIHEHGYTSKIQGRWFVDIGANIGSMTVYAHQTGIFDGALCFEPEPLNFRILEINKMLNGMDDCRLWMARRRSRGARS